MKNRIIVVGPGGSGKDFLANRLKQMGYRKAVSHTTRPPRVGEKDGVDYYFVTPSFFTALVAEGHFKEWYTFGDKKWMYGTTLEEFNKANLFIMSPPVLKGLGSDVRETSLIVFLDIPEDVRRSRLGERSDADSVERRLCADAVDFLDFKEFDILVSDPLFCPEQLLRSCLSVVS